MQAARSYYTLARNEVPAYYSARSLALLVLPVQTFYKHVTEGCIMHKARGTRIAALRINGAVHTYSSTQN